jgi:hypothetical protein
MREQIVGELAATRKEQRLRDECADCAGAISMLGA